MKNEEGAALTRGATPRREAKPERLGRIVCGCEIREIRVPGGHRHHHYVGVLRDLIDNVWECSHQHSEQDSAHECARSEYARRASLAIGAGAQPAD